MIEWEREGGRKGEIQTDRDRDRFTIGISSHNSDAKKSHNLSSACKPEKTLWFRRQWCNSVQLWRPKTKRANGVSPRIQKLNNQECWYPKAWEDGHPNSSREQIHLPCTSLFYSGPQQGRGCHLQWWVWPLYRSSSLSEIPSQAHSEMSINKFHQPPFLEKKTILSTAF